MQLQSKFQKFSWWIFEKPILKFIWKDKRSRLDSMIPKKNEVGGQILFDFKTYYKAAVIKRACCWQKS